MTDLSTRAKFITEALRGGVWAGPIPEDVIGLIPADAISSGRTAVLANPTLAAATGGAYGPSVVMEVLPDWHRGDEPISIDRYSSNPLVTAARQQMPGANFTGPPPEMFSTGPLPLFCASGLAVELLRWVPWRLRHMAAFSADRGHILRAIEEADDFDAARQLQTAQGLAALRDYEGRVRAWVMSVPAGEPLTTEEMTGLFSAPQNPGDVETTP
jgi:hypothetical protein